jgi:hypothetical protein
MILTLSQHGLRNALGVATDDSVELADSHVKLSLELRRRGVEARLMIGGVEPRSSCIDKKLVESVAQARQWMDRLTEDQG